jgi:ferredoxin--NADP+ reductase
VIGTNKKCAAGSTTLIAADAEAGALPEPTAEPTFEWVRERAPHAIDWEGWLAIDEHEKRLGEESGRPRIKLVTADDLRAASRGALTR